MALQSTALGIAIAFSPSPWYGAYATTTATWGLTPIEDQQIAGLIMWIPAGAIYLAAALLVLGRMLVQQEEHAGLTSAGQPAESNTSERTASKDWAITHSARLPRI
jgi:cytochrome c oxidase assembly factor CtaG